MKTLGLLLILGLFLSSSLLGQTAQKNKLDSVWKNDSLYSGFLHNQLKQRYSFNNKFPKLTIPEKKLLPESQNLAMALDSGKIVLREPNTRMPVLVPKIHSKMPVMKPDPNVHYFLLIKKF